MKRKQQAKLTLGRETVRTLLSTAEVAGGLPPTTSCGATRCPTCFSCQATTCCE